MEALKEKIEEDRGKEAFPAVGQKLIYAGEPAADGPAERYESTRKKSFVKHLLGCLKE